MNVPDRNTIWRFGERLGVDGATVLFQGVDAQLHRHGYIARGGQAIDATLVPAPRQRLDRSDREALAEGRTPDWSEAERRQRDVDATHTKKHGKRYFGYKLSVSVDLKHGFIRRIATGTASEHDGHHFDEVLDMHNTGRSVHTDKAYASRQRRQMLQVLGGRDAAPGPAGPALERVPEAAQPAHCQQAGPGRTCVCRYPAHGRQVRAHHRAGAGHGGDDDDGGLLQHEAPGVIPASGSGCVLQA